MVGTAHGEYLEWLSQTRDSLQTEAEGLADLYLSTKDSRFAAARLLILDADRDLATAMNALRQEDG